MAKEIIIPGYEILRPSFYVRDETYQGQEIKRFLFLHTESNIPQKAIVDALKKAIERVKSGNASSELELTIARLGEDVRERLADAKFELSDSEDCNDTSASLLFHSGLLLPELLESTKPCRDGFWTYIRILAGEVDRTARQDVNCRIRLIDDKLPDRGYLEPMLQDETTRSRTLNVDCEEYPEFRELFDTTYKLLPKKIKGRILDTTESAKELHAMRLADKFSLSAVLGNNLGRIVHQIVHQPDEDPEVNGPVN